MAAAVEPIELPITANTDRFARKLRLIAKAYADLADALEAIDNEPADTPVTEALGQPDCDVPKGA